MSLMVEVQCVTGFLGCISSWAYRRPQYQCLLHNKWMTEWQRATGRHLGTSLKVSRVVGKELKDFHLVVSCHFYELPERSNFEHFCYFFFLVPSREQALLTFALLDTFLLTKGMSAFKKNMSKIIYSGSQETSHKKLKCAWYAIWLQKENRKVR